MEFLKAWIWKEKKLIEQGKDSADPTLLKYVEKLVVQMQSLMDTKLIRRTKTGNFELAELADYQVQARELDKKRLSLQRRLKKRDEKIVRYKSYLKESRKKNKELEGQISSANFKERKYNVLIEQASKQLIELGITHVKLGETPNVKIQN